MQKSDVSDTGGVRRPDTGGNNHMRKIFGVTAIAVAVLGIGAGTAAAAPPEPFTVECNGVTYEITAPNGRWAAAQSVDRSTHFIPYAFNFTVTDQAGNILFQESETKGGKAHQNQDGKLTCTFSETFEENGQVLTFSGIAEVIQRP